MSLKVLGSARFELENLSAPARLRSARNLPSSAQLSGSSLLPILDFCGHLTHYLPFVHMDIE